MLLDTQPEDELPFCFAVLPVKEFVRIRQFLTKSIAHETSEDTQQIPECFVGCMHEPTCCNREVLSIL